MMALTALKGLKALKDLKALKGLKHLTAHGAPDDQVMRSRSLRLKALRLLNVSDLRP